MQNDGISLACVVLLIGTAGACELGQFGALRFVIQCAVILAAGCAADLALMRIRARKRREAKRHGR